MADRERLLQEAQVLEELATRRQVCPIATFAPHPKQEKWLTSLAPIVLYAAGNRSGKTHVLVAKLISAVLGYYPWLVPNLKLQLNAEGKWDFPPRSMVPSAAWMRRLDGLPINIPSKNIMVTGLPLERGIGEIIQTKWLDLWPKQVEFKPYLGPLGAWKKLIAPNGSEVYFGAATQGELSLEGFAADYAAVDEPVPARVFTAMRRGLVDRRGQISLTLTPLGDAAIAWLAADLMSGRPDVDLVRGSGFDNPHIDHQALKEFLDDPSMPDAERRARRDGEVAALGYRIVTTFDASTAVIPSTTIEPDVPRLCVLDPHHARPPFILWLAVYGHGDEFVVYREWPEQDFFKAGVPAVTLDKLAGIIKAAEGKELVKYRVTDPNMGPAHARKFGEQFRSFVEEMYEYDLHFAHNVDDDLDRGIQCLRDAFKVDAISQRPKVRIMAHCRNLISALNYWSYESKDGSATKPSEKYKDPVDCLRYGLMYNLPWFSEQGGSNYLLDSWGETSDE